MDTIRILFIALALACALPQTGRAECCSPPGQLKPTCQDGTTQWGCCGVGRCNIFCCNCDGGCRKSHNAGECKANCESLKGNCNSGCTLTCEVARDCGICSMYCDKDFGACQRACDEKFPAKGQVKATAQAGAEVLEGLSRFATVDKDRNGSISRVEFDAAFGQRPGGTGSAFKDMDKNGDERLTLDEVDGTSATYLQEQVKKEQAGNSPQRTYVKAVAKALAENPPAKK